MSTTIESVAVHMERWSDLLGEMLDQLLLDYGDVYDRRRAFDNSMVTLVTGTPYSWPALPIAGQRAQSHLFDEYRRFSAVLAVLLQGQAKALTEDLQHYSSVVVNLIERDAIGDASKEAAQKDGRRALQAQLDILRGVHSGRENELIIVPDTNALYWNPALEQWRFTSPFTLAITPIVIRELDRHKADRQNTVRQAKAERLVRQITEYRRRGRFVDGVPLVRGLSEIMGVATEPRLSDTWLPWLDPTNADDQFIGAAIEVMRLNCRSAVVIVTRDLNLQNKIELARLPFLMPSNFIEETSVVGCKVSTNVNGGV